MQTVDQFLQTIENETRLNDARTLIELIERITGTPAVMWGSIIGFGGHHYKYESGREGNTVAVGFSPRKSSLVFYNLQFDEKSISDIEKLGKTKQGKGCLYINNLNDVDVAILANMIDRAYKRFNNLLS